ncbi:MAG: ATP-binding protein [Chitinophagia bacterium]
MMYNFDQAPNPVLDGIKKLYDDLQDSKLSETVINANEAEIATLRVFFECEDDQAVILALFCQMHYNNTQPSVRELIEHLAIKTSSALVINKLLKLFVEREWIYPKQDLMLFPLCEYGIAAKFIRCVTTMEWKYMATKPLTSSFDLLHRFNNKLSDRKSRKISYDGLVNSTYELIKANGHIELAAFIVAEGMNPDEAAYYLAMCYQYFEGYVNIDKDSIISNFKPTMEKQYAFRHEFNSRSSIFFTQELIRENRADDMFNSLEYCLTDKAVHSFDKNDIPRKPYIEGMLKELKPESITGKALFFEPDAEVLVNKLQDLLQVNNFKKLKIRLEQQGLKPGVSILLYGQPGTGKTETVLQLAKQSNRHVLMSDASKIRSKWIGETEKNIRKLFTDYKKACENFEELPVLLFNEADAIIGKRGQVNDRGDQMENALQNILLEELENFEGIFIATTNMEDNLDKAFDRRFLYKIKFEVPSSTTIAAIWKDKFPQIGEGVINNLCEKVKLTGGQIENVRKKLIVDSLLDAELDPSEQYLLQQAEQEISLQQKSAQRNVIGFNRA